MARNEVVSTQSPTGDRSTELDWVAQHRREFADKWVVVENDHLVASGDNAKEVFSAAKRQGIHVPFLVHVEPPDSPPFGGW